MEKIRVGVVGLGHRGRAMFSLAVDAFDCAIAAAACDIRQSNCYEKQWLSDAAFAEKYCAVSENASPTTPISRSKRHIFTT